MPYKDNEKRKKFAREWARKKRQSDPDFRKRNNDTTKRWIKNNRVKYLEQRKRWRAKQDRNYWNRQNEGQNKRRLIARKKVINHYGSKCSCCGEINYDFLTIDHKNGGGTKHRKIITATYLPFWIVKNNFPEDYQILCYNCNGAKAFNKLKICPHKNLPPI